MQSDLKKIEQKIDRLIKITINGFDRLGIKIDASKYIASYGGWGEARKARKKLAKTSLKI